MSTGVTVDFNANLARFTGAIDKATNDLNKFQSNAQRVSANMSKAFGALGVGLSVGGVVAYGKAIIDLADEMNDLSQRVGINIKNLATWQLAANQSGTSIESVAKGVKGLSTFMVENGSALKAAGINATDANGALIELSDLFKAMPDGIEKTNLAVKLFGKAGMDMIPMLNLGSEGLKEAQEKAKAYGERLAELAPKADAFNDQMAELALQSKAAGMNITDVLLPGLIGMATWLNDLAAGGDRGATAMEFLSEKTSKFTNLIPQLRVMAELAERVGPALALAGVGGDQGRRSSSGNIAGGAGDLAAFDAATADFMKSREAQRRAKGLLGKGDAGKPGKAGKTGKSDLQKMLDLAAERQAGMIDSGEGGLSVATVSAQYAAKAAADNIERLNGLLAETPTGQLTKARDEMQFLAAALEQGAINEQQFLEAVGMHYGQATEALDEMSQFAIEAARNMQDAMADGFFDIMQGNFDKLGDNFKKTIDRMVANAMAANLSQHLLGDFGKTGNLGGALGGLVKGGGGNNPDEAGGGFFSFLSGLLPKFDVGTPYVPRDMVAMIHKGERIVPAAQNNSGGMGMTNVFNFTLSAPSDRRTQEQVAAMAGMGIQRALARNA